MRKGVPDGSLADATRSVSNNSIPQISNLSTPSSKNSSDDTQASYTPPKSETFQELLSQHKSGLITDEEFEEMLLGKKPYTDPLSLINTKPEDFSTTPDVKKKTGTFDGDGTRDTIIAKGRSTIFNTAFKNDVSSDDYIQKYMTITNKETLKAAAKELDEGGCFEKFERAKIKNSKKSQKKPFKNKKSS